MISPAAPQPDPNLAWEEYKMLQEKLDSIGDFRFRVKGWVVSICATLVIGATALKQGTVGLMLAGWLVLLFWFLEFYYARVHGAVAGRLRTLEQRLRRADYFAQRSAGRSISRDATSPQLVRMIEHDLGGRTWSLLRWVHHLFYVAFLLGLVVARFAIDDHARPLEVVMARSVALDPIQISETVKPGQIDLRPKPEAAVGPSNASAGSTNASAGPTNASAGPTNASAGSTNASTGSANASTGSATTSTGSANALVAPAVPFSSARGAP